MAFLDLLLPSCIYDTVDSWPLLLQGHTADLGSTCSPGPSSGQGGEQQAELISDQQEPICTVSWGYSSQGAGLHLCLCWISEVLVSPYLQSEQPYPLAYHLLPPNSALSADLLRVHSVPLGH